MTTTTLQNESTMRTRRHRHHANPFTIRNPIQVPNWDEVFGRTAPFALDIGCGPGRFILELGATHPEWNVIGLEIRQHLIEEALTSARAAGLGNVYAILANANVHLMEMLPLQSVMFVSINFPDPWYKNRHHKRRVVQPAWLDDLATKLAPGAELHAMSDYEPVAQQIRDVVQASPGFENLDGRDNFATSSTTGLSTEREQKHLLRGDPVYRMRFRFQPREHGAKTGYQLVP